MCSWKERKFAVKKGEGQVKVEANSQYCEIQVSLLDQPLVVEIGSYVNQLY